MVTAAKLNQRVKETDRNLSPFSLKRKGEMDFERYISDYSASFSGVLATSRSKLLKFCTNRELLTVEHQLSSAAITAGTGKPFFSTPRADRLIPAFINDMPKAIRSALFEEKLFQSRRGEKIRAALSGFFGWDEEEVRQARIVDVCDRSTGRALITGHFVYRLTLALPRGERRTFYLKGIAKDDARELKRYPGWERHKEMTKYDAFFQKIAVQLGISEYHNRYISADRDPHVRALIVSEEVVGEPSHNLFRRGNHLAQRLYQNPRGRLARSYLKSLARWHAVSDLFAKGDRRMQRTPRLKRDSNFIVRTRNQDTVILESIDHELIFSPESALVYQSKKRYTELEGLRIFSKEDFPEVLEFYQRAYLREARRLRSPKIFNSLFQQVFEQFGAASFELETFMAKALQTPREFLRQQLAERFGIQALAGTRKKVEADLPLQMRRLSKLFGCQLYDKRKTMGGSYEWSQAARRAGPIAEAASCSVFERFQKVECAGAINRNSYRGRVTELLGDLRGKNSSAWAENESRYWIMIEPSGNVGLSFRFVADKEKLKYFCSALLASARKADWKITMLPYRKIGYQGNIIVAPDDSVRGEFSKGSKQPSRSQVDPTLRFETLPFISRYPRIFSEDPRFWEVVKAVMEKFPRSDITGRPIPGYFEVAVGYRHENSNPEIFFQDYWAKY